MDSTQINFTIDVGVIVVTTISIVVAYFLGKVSERMQKEGLKSNGCPNVIFNDVQEFEADETDNKHTLFKIRFHDRNGFLLKKAKLKKITIQKSKYTEKEEYGDEKFVYDNPCANFEDLEFTPRSDNKIDKLINKKEDEIIGNSLDDFYYLSSHLNIDYDINELRDSSKYIKLIIQMSVLTIYNLETELTCNIIFDKANVTDRIENKKRLCYKKICHRFTTFGKIDYIKNPK